MSKILLTAQEKYLNSFKKNRSELLLEIESFAKQNSIPILNWLAAEFLEQLVLIQRPLRVLEIGTAIGYSTIRIASQMRKKSMLDTIESSRDNIAIAVENFRKSNLDAKINLIEGDAIDIMPTLKHKYDLIFLDADKEDYEKLFYYSLMLMNKRGIFFVDNLMWHGYAASSKPPAKYRDSTKHIKEFNILFTSQNTLQTTILPIGDGIGIGVKIE